MAVLTPAIALAESGFILGASVGSAELSDDFGGFDVDANSTAYRFTVGWKFNDYLAIEGGYHNFGRFDQSFDIEGTSVDVSLKADGFTLGVVGQPATWRSLVTVCSRVQAHSFGTEMPTLTMCLRSDTRRHKFLPRCGRAVCNERKNCL